MSKFDEATFSVNMYDDEGDNFDNCVLVHVDNTLIIRFNNADEIDEFAKRLTSLSKEIRMHWK